ncbi:hypothetical protein BEWA_002710 [Theileria equi strain WA]|uniref:Uncharacterized protein n=1 Tax=Theileria equi strain WA TaxID=1537102 RepID=L0B163_THEEQ|nr:hypothetical protein BEWA_002710 [Theileria equi strain WA]AFZ80864.1 hypothetical protein BEWA_002710 [Theileria equi strain WA]|eukprot:XP_004830530.1 hypothetical protein BEWA_002710 [Theileria equi strain WA]
MPELGKLNKAVEDVMSACFSGTLDQLKDKVQALLRVDAGGDSNVIEKTKNAKDYLTSLELSALESIRDSQKHSVAHIAAAGGNVEILQTLLTASPSFAHIEDENGENPLFYAIRAAESWKGDHGASKDLSKSDRMACLLLLIAHSGPNSMSKRGASALHIASELGDSSICKILLENQADVSLSVSAFNCRPCDITEVLASAILHW